MARFQNRRRNEWNWLWPLITTRFEHAYKHFLRSDGIRRWSRGWLGNLGGNVIAALCFLSLIWISVTLEISSGQQSVKTCRWWLSAYWVHLTEIVKYFFNQNIGLIGSDRYPTNSNVWPWFFKERTGHWQRVYGTCCKPISLLIFWVIMIVTVATILLGENDSDASSIGIVVLQPCSTGPFSEEYLSIRKIQVFQNHSQSFIRFQSTKFTKT